MARPPLEIGEWGTIARITTPHGPAARAYYRDASGNFSRVQRRGKTPAQAERLLKAALEAMSEMVDGGSTITRESELREVAELYFSELSLDKRKDGTRTTYQSVYDRHIKDEIGNVKLRQLTVGRLDNLIRSRRDTPSTAKSVRVVLINIFDVAVRHDAIRINLARNTKPVKVAPKKVTALSPEQVKGMLNLFKLAHIVEGKDIYDEILLLAVTGMRTGELLAGEWAEVDLAPTNAVLRITGTIVVDADTGKLKKQDMGKSLAATRGLTLPSTVSDRLRSRYELSNSEKLFPSRSGTFQWQNNFRRRWRGVIEGTEYEGYTPRDFRKAVATYLDRKVGREGARDHLGHESEDVTTKYYIEQQEHVTDFAAHLEELISK